MYTIIKRGEGKWLGIYGTQDGTQRFEESTREKAIKRMIYCAKIMNGVGIIGANIDFVDGPEYGTERMVFMQDNDCHWYLIPATEAEEFSITLAYEDEWQEFDERWGDKRLVMHPSCYSFTDLQERKT